MNDCGCEKFADRVIEYLDSEVDSSESAILKAHVAHCRECTETAEAEQHIREVIRRSCREQAPEALRVRVHTQLTVMRISSAVQAPRRLPPAF